MRAALFIGFQCRNKLCVALTVLAVGCSSEPAAPPSSPASTTSKPAIADNNNPSPAPWSVETLGVGEFDIDEGFRELSLDDFEVFFAKPPANGKQMTWQSIHNAIVCTGKPKGYLHSKEKFKDFTLRLEFRFAPLAEGTDPKKFNPNTGVLVYITGPHKQWPKSLEVQGKFSEMGKINPNGGVAAVELVDDPAAREIARKPIGEWNGFEIVSKDGALTARLNGTKVCESQPGDVSEGAIGLQSEDFEVHFRRIRVRAE